MLLLLNICMAMYIPLLFGKVLWINDKNKVSTLNTSKVLDNTKLYS